MTPADIPKLGDWLLAGDTGVSSETMAAIALGATVASSTRRWGLGDAPHDPSDFGRCYRLVQAVPSIRQDFERIAQAVPAFRAILREWDGLCAIYLRDLPTGESAELYARITALRAEGGAA